MLAYKVLDNIFGYHIQTDITQKSQYSIIQLDLYDLYIKNLIGSEYYIFFYNKFKNFIISDYKCIYFLFNYPDKRLLVRLLENYKGELYESFVLDYDKTHLYLDLTMNMNLIYNTDFDNFVSNYILGRTLTAEMINVLL